MTPKEKAEELWMKFFQKQIDITGSGDGNLCVEMALISVDEILTLLESEGIKYGSIFWKNVKQEIEKL